MGAGLSLYYPGPGHLLVGHGLSRDFYMPSSWLPDGVAERVEALRLADRG